MKKLWARIWRNSIRRQLIFAVAGVHAVLMSLFVWDTTERQKQMLLQLQSEQAQAVAQAMATSAAGWLAAHDVAGLQEIVEAQLRHQDLVFALFLDREGLVVAHTDRSRIGLYVQDCPRGLSSRWSAARLNWSM